MTDRTAVLKPIWAEADGTVLAYMCRTDWECEIGGDMLGTTLYPTVEELRACRSCVDTCGIVEVRVAFSRLVEPGADESEAA